MQGARVCLALHVALVAISFGSSGATLAVADSSASPSTPVGRVVTLLKGLSDKVEHEGQEEEKLYYKFVCWAQSIIDQKKASNAEAAARIDYLTTYIADIEAGRIEFTSERVDLEKEIATLNEDMEIATGIREKEAEDYEMAKDEMNKAITALTSALEVLHEASADHKEGVMLARMKARLNSRTSASSQAASLSHAVELGNKFLNKGDAFFLSRVLTGEVPTWDWKKLNRKATFKMSYKARSFKIQDVLGKLLETFTTNLEDATTKEKEAKAVFDKLMSSKTDELDAAKTALLKLEKESGASGMSKADAQAELDSLKQQVTDDEKYIEEVKTALAKKKAEWKTRQTLRAGELSAISKAIAILHNDDARDLFKKSFESQGYSFLQEREESQTAMSRIINSAEAALRVGSIKDKRVAAIVSKLDRKRAAVMTGAAPAPALADKLHQGTHFDDVITAIDNMIQVLKDEEADDLKNKEDCEKDRADDTRDAVLDARAIDDFTETIVRLRGEIEELAKEIKKNDDAIGEIVKDLADAKAVRDEEKAEYQKNKKDDQDALAVIRDAKNVLEKFYRDNNLMLAQKNKKQPVSEAGKAPPPPPKTWDGAYGGATGESKGIVAILGMIEEDVKKDIAKSDTDDADANAMYIKTKSRLNAEKGEIEGLNIQLSGSKSGKEGDVTTAKQQRTTKKGELDVTLKKISGAEPGCNYFTINYAVRVRDRQIEIDGLLKAKAILGGASFDAPDPNREIKPGDALLQRRK